MFSQFVQFLFVWYPGALTKLLGDAQDRVAELKHKGKVEEADALAEKTLALASFLGELRNKTLEAGELDKNAVDESAIADLQEMAVKAMAHKDGMKETLKRAN